MSKYLNKLTKVKLLTKEEEQELTNIYFQNKDLKVRDKLVKHNMRLVIKAAHKHNITKNMLNDLVQEGAIGLLKGIDKYDPTRGVKFGGYVYFWIRAYMLRYIVNNAHPVKMGTTQAQRKLFFNLAKTKAKLAAQGAEITDESLAEILGVKLEEIREMQQRMAGPPISLDIHDSNQDESNMSRGNYIERNREDILLQEGSSPADCIEQKEKEVQIKSLLGHFKNNLSDRELFILENRLYGQEKKTLQEIGDMFKLSKERIRQVESLLKNRVQKLLVRNQIS